MAFTRNGSVQPGAVPTIAETATEKLGIEAQPLQQDTPQQNAFDDLQGTPGVGVSEPVSPDVNSLSFAEGEYEDIEATQIALEEGIDEQAALAEQLERERITPMTQRRSSEEKPSWSYENPRPIISTDGGMGARIKAVHSNISNPEVTSTSQQSSLGQLGMSIGAITPNVMGNTDVDPMFSHTLAAVTEKYFADKLSGENDPFDSTLQPMSASEQMEEGRPTPETQVKKSDDPTRLGQEIYREYQRIRNAQQGIPTDQYTDLEPKDAAFLGDFAKEIYAHSMGDAMPRFKDTQGNVVFGVTSEFLLSLDAARQYRDAIMPKQIVRALKAPSETGKMLGEQQKYTREHSGKIGKGSVTSKQHEEARKNLASIPNVVDSQRLKILLATMLPALMSDVSVYKDDPIIGLYADMHGFGQKKVDKYTGQQRLKEGQPVPAGQRPYDAMNEMDKLKRVIAQQLYGISQERHGANYLTYSIQAFNGRLSPMQSLFNPTTSKAVRFVTRNAVPTKIEKNGKNWQNAIQAYALVIGQNIDMYVPSQRAAAMVAQTPQLEAWGRRLKEVLNNTMTDEQVAQVADAIAKGIPANDPNFPKFNLMALDPEKDANLIKAIKDKKEDGAAFIDGLIDFANFQANIRRGQPHYSYLNPTIDGKTNGIASNGIQMGDMKTAIRTGVIRSEDSLYALQDNVDIRDELESIFIDSIKDGIEGHFNPEDEKAILALATAAATTRDLNKEITMTFGYGKEIDSFRDSIKSYLYENPTEDVQAFLKYFENHDTLTIDDITAIIMNKYIPAIEQVMSEDGIESRHMMWGVAFMNAMADTVFEIEGPTGYKLRYGGKESDPNLTEKAGQYKIKGVGRTAKMYGNRATSAAGKTRTSIDEHGNKIVALEIGGRAWGGAVPGPVQSIDAATVVRTMSGKSWEKIKAAAGGNPYVHQIYDAFKFDIASFGVGAREVNQNWAKTAFEWSYLYEAQKSMTNAQNVFREKLNALPDGKPIPLSHFPFIKYLLNAGGKQGDYPTNLIRKLKSLAPYKKGQSQEQRNEWAKNLAQTMMKRFNIRGGQETMTKEQLRAFANMIMKETQLNSRLANLYKKTEAKKDKLYKIVMDPRNEIMQYHAH